MLTLLPNVRVYLAVEPADMRGSFDALAGRVRRMGMDPQNGQLYIFTSRRRKLAKVLYFDKTGWCMFQKRLEVGTYQIPEVRPGEDRVLVDPAMLASLLEGIDLGAKRRRWYGRREQR